MFRLAPYAEPSPYKIYDYEKRLSKSFAPLHFGNAQLVSRKLLAYTGRSDDVTQTEQVLKKTLTSQEDSPPLALGAGESEKLLIKAATLYGVLDRFGFSKDRIVQCLTSVRVLELEDVLDWVSFRFMFSQNWLLMPAFSWYYIALSLSCHLSVCPPN